APHSPSAASREAAGECPRLPQRPSGLAAGRAGLNARALAARVLAGVLADGRTLEESLLAVRVAEEAGRDAALVRELCAGVLRWHPRLAFVASLLLRRPLS